MGASASQNNGAAGGGSFLDKIQENLREIEEKSREGVQLQGKRKRVEPATEALQDRVVEDPAELIERIDVDEKPSEQVKELSALYGASLTILRKLHDRGVLVKSRADLASAPVIEAGEKLYEEAQGKEKEVFGATFEKVQEMFAHPAAPSSAYFFHQLDEYFGIAPEVNKTADTIVAETAAPAESQEKGKGVIATFKNLSGNQKIVVATCVIGGLVGLYYLASSLFGKKEESADGKKSSGSGAVLGGVILGLSLAGVGVTLGAGKLTDWIQKKLGFDVAADKLKEVENKLKKGKSDEAMEILRKEVLRSSVYKKLAATWHLSLPALSGLAGEEYEEYDDWSDLKEVQGKMALWDKSPDFDYIKEKREKAQAELKLTELFIKYREHLVHPTPPATVHDGIAVLHMKGLLSVPDPLAEDQEKERNPELETAGVSPEEVDTTIESAQKNGAVHLVAVLRKFKEGERLPNLPTFWSEVYEAIGKDKMPLVVGGGKVLVGFVASEGGGIVKFLTLTSLSAAYHAALEAVKAPFSDEVDMLDVASVYVEEAEAWVVASLTIIGAYAGSKASKAGFVNTIKGGLKGAGRGFLYPVEVARLEFNAGRRVWEEVTGRGRFMVRYLTTPEELKARFWTDKAEHYAKMFRKYNMLSSFRANAPWFENIPGFLKKFYVRHFFWSQEHLDLLRTHYAEAFAQAHNEQLGYERGLGRGLVKGDAGYLDIDQHERQHFNKTDEASKRVLEQTERMRAPISQAMLNQKAAEIARQRITKALPDFSQRQLETVLDEHGLKLGTPDANRFLNQWDHEMAERLLRGREIGDGMPEFAKVERVRFVKDLGLKGKVYSYKGLEITLSNHEAALEPVSRKAICDRRWEAKVFDSLRVEEVRGAGGKITHRVNGKLIEGQGGASLSSDEARKRFLDLFPNDPKAIELAACGKWTRGTIAFIEWVKPIIGPATTLAILYGLNSADDKRKAIAMTTVGFGTFFLGKEAFAATLAKKVSNPAWKAILTVCAGLAAAYGLTEPIDSMVDEYVLSKVPGGYAASEALIEMLGTVTLVSTPYAAFRALTWAAEKNLVGKIGLHALQERLLKSTLIKTVEETVAKKGLFAMVKRMFGWRGVAFLVQLCDDWIPVIGQATTIGFGLLLGYDAIGAIWSIYNGYRFQKAVNERNKYDICSVEIMNSEAKESLRKKFAEVGGLPEDPSLALGELDGNKIDQYLAGEPRVELKVLRTGAVGHEIWTYENGEMVGDKIMEGDEVVAEMDGKDAAVLQKARDEDVEEESDGGRVAVAASGGFFLTDAVAHTVAKIQKEVEMKQIAQNEKTQAEPTTVASHRGRNRYVKKEQESGEQGDAAHAS